MDIRIDETVDKAPYYKKISDDKVINITGEGGSGKSTIASKYKKDDNYIVVDYDLIMLNPEEGTIEYELRQLLLNKYGEVLFKGINELGLDKVKENFTTMYTEIINYLSKKETNKTIVLDGSQLRFINDVQVIKGEVFVLRPSIQTCISQSVKRYIQKNPQATIEQIQEYTQKRTNILYQLNPLMNELLIKVSTLPEVEKKRAELFNQNLNTIFSDEIIYNILNRISENEDYKNPITKEQFLQSINQKGYNIITTHKKLENELEQKLKSYAYNKSQFQPDCLYEYAAYIITLIKEDYKTSIKPEAIERLEDLITQKKIVLCKKEQGTAHTDGSIEIPWANPADPLFIRNVRYSLDTLLHEIFHQTHRYRVGEDLNIIVNEKEVVAKNFGGYLFEEGLTDKCTVDFARKHQLSCSPFFEYHIYTQLVAAVEKQLGVTNEYLFDKDYRQIFNKIDPTGQMLEHYRFAELSRYASTAKKRKAKVEFVFNGKKYEAQEFPSLKQEIKSQNAIINNEEQKKYFDQRSEIEIQIAEQIRIKNQAIAQQKQKKPKMLVKTSATSSLTSKGYINGVILSFIVSGMLAMIIYFLFK